jgi:uncharacterized glyoxalase superfamily protein PhnB
MLKKLTPNLMVEDVNQTIAFYRDILGFEPGQTVPTEGQYAWASMTSGEVEIMFQARASLGEELPGFRTLSIGGSLTLFIQMQGVKELYERVKDRVIIVQDLHDTFYGMREFALQDCNRYTLAFAEALGR